MVAKNDKAHKTVSYTHLRLKKCPSCGSIDINDYGMGTEKLEQYIKENYSKAKVCLLYTSC